MNPNRVWWRPLPRAAAKACAWPMRPCPRRELAALSAGDELLAVEIRYALDELGKILGTVYTDDILDRIFRRFCIGK